MDLEDKRYCARYTARMSSICIMGVSGCGKSSVGAAIATRLGLPFIEGDDFHPPPNVAKMSSGVALTNADRAGWIETLSHAVSDAGPCIFSCSALNPTIRGWLNARIAGLRYVHLHAPQAVLAERMAARPGHFMRPEMLGTQFAALDAPTDALSVSVDQPLDAVINAVIRGLDEQA